MHETKIELERSTTGTVKIADARERASFARDGFLFVRGFFTASEIAELRDAVDREVTVSRKNAALPRPDEFLWRRSHEVARFSLHAGLGAFAADLLGVRFVRLIHDVLFEKTPGASATTWHRDSDFWAIAGVGALTMWIPLQETPAATALRYIPGSHRFAKREPLKRHEKALLPLQQPVVSPNLHVGDIAVHLYSTLHGAAPNRGTTTRRAFALHLMDADATIQAPFNRYCEAHNVRAGWNALRPGERFPDQVAPPLV